jgi:hypothetical protein
MLISKKICAHLSFHFFFGFFFQFQKVDMARNIYYQSMFGHISIEITKHSQN